MYKDKNRFFRNKGNNILRDFMGESPDIRERRRVNHHEKKLEDDIEDVERQIKQSEEDYRKGIDRFNEYSMKAL